MALCSMLASFIVNAVFAYGVAKLDFAELNPGLFLVFRPFSWFAGLAIPFGLWAMRRWAILLYVLIQTLSVVLIHLVQPPWAAELPSWALPVAILFPVLFLATVLPYWSAMSSRVP